MNFFIPIQVHVSADKIFCITEMTMNPVSYVKSCQEACDIETMFPTIMNEFGSPVHLTAKSLINWIAIYKHDVYSSQNRRVSRHD